MLPGWGQLYKGESVKGWTLVGLWGAAVAGTVATHALRSQARADYLDATDPAEIAERYADFNAWHRARGVLALGAVAVWTVAVGDALAFGGPEPPTAVRVGLTAEGELSLRVSF